MGQASSGSSPDLLGDPSIRSMPCQMLAERPWASPSASGYLSSATCSGATVNEAVYLEEK